MKRSFAVVTDSTADLPDEWRDRYGIEVVPLKVLFGTETFRDRVDMTDEQRQHAAFRYPPRARRWPMRPRPCSGGYRNAACWRCSTRCATSRWAGVSAGRRR